MFDMRNRWTYKGSVTTPPCAENVYWNVLKTIYPIKQKYVDQFKSQLAREPGLENYGNWREIQPFSEAHNPVVLYSANRPSAGAAAPAAAAAPAKAATAAPAAGGTVSLQQQGTIIV